jgi:long-chain acyl-CoA synthetase
VAAEQFDDFDSFSNLVSMFLTRARYRGDAPFLWAKKENGWSSLRDRKSVV